MALRDRIRGLGARLRGAFEPPATHMAQPTAAAPATPSRPTTRKLGTAGTRVTGGRIWGKESNRDLQGAKWVAVAEEMRRTDAMLMAVERALIGTQLTATWRFTVPDDASPLAVQAKDFLNANFGLDGARGRLSGGWEGVLSQALLFQGLGYRYLEEVYFIEGGRVWVDFADCEPSAHFRWNVDGCGDLESVTQQSLGGDYSTPGNPVVPGSKLVLFTHGRTGANFEGVGLLRPCWMPWKLKGHTLSQIAIGVERWAVPTPIVRSDLKALQEQGFSPEEQTTMVGNAKASAKAYLAHESAYLASVPGIDFDVFGGGTLDTAGPSAVVDLCDRQMMTAWGLQFLLLGVNDTGSRAVGDVQESFFRRQAVNGLDQVAAVVGGAPGPARGTVGRLMRWNFPALRPSEWPRLEHRGLDPGPLLELIGQLPALGAGGFVTPTGSLENAILDAFKQPPLARMYERTPEERAASSSPVGAASALLSGRNRSL